MKGVERHFWDHVYRKRAGRGCVPLSMIQDDGLGDPVDKETKKPNCVRIRVNNKMMRRIKQNKGECYGL